MTDCPVCKKRQEEERKQLGDCEGKRVRLEAKNQKLTLVLAVVGTLVGKETLDQALALANFDFAASTGNDLTDSLASGSSSPGSRPELDTTAPARKTSINEPKTGFAASAQSQTKELASGNSGLWDVDFEPVKPLLFPRAGLERGQGWADLPVDWLDFGPNESETLFPHLGPVLLELDWPRSQVPDAPAFLLWAGYWIPARSRYRRF